MSIGFNENDRRSWRKAIRSINNGACVEVAATSGMVVVRDSMDPDGLIMHYPVNSWLPFVAKARRGGFDTLP
jgi:hypothetical protein